MGLECNGVSQLPDKKLTTSLHSHEKNSKLKYSVLHTDSTDSEFELDDCSGGDYVARCSRLEGEDGAFA